ncbi:hypothetical protein NS228_05160 [Methylobacterium indicum]|uniref:tyrosine-type recombinase/integrase n=1 Tax=Methylobacterium indicum TaxID=1775910 RepID=UPI00073499FA|nr:tyrosine-type recombinase/integrase [Methylobacterium indicum]KTS34243.1 hypothetical protein NS229_11565 [Methylobacterium indicum]KTS41772.1 hypothetical protein NS228_05160 [Methylobacterium indicum]KTS53131.1 hypothetical protein NS230_07815 [Methylobacterium indicum]
MAESHGVYLPKGSSIYYRKVQVRKKKRGTSTGCRSKKEAIAFARRWKASLLAEARAAPPAGSSMTFLQAVNRFMKEVGEKLSASAQYEVFFDWLVEEIGADTPLSAIDNSMVADLMADRAEEFRYGDPKNGTVAPSYVQRSVLIPLRSVLRRAKDLWEVSLPREPAWGKHKVADSFRTRVMSWGEEAAIRAVVDDDLWALIEFVLLSGLRRKDALVTWDQVDRIDRVIRVTAKGGRPHQVRITPRIGELLDQAADVSGQRQEVWTWVSSRGAEAGVRQPVNYGMFQKLWEAAIERAGVKGLTIHDLRRTAGERVYRATGDIAAVSRFLGHANIELTKRYYLHVTPDDVEERQLAMEWVRAKSLDQHASLPRLPRRLRRTSVH